MGAGGHNSSSAASGKDETALLQAVPGRAAAVTLEVLWLTPHSYVQVYIDDSATPVIFTGTDLQIYPEPQRTFRSKVDGAIRVMAYAEGAEAVPGPPNFFSLSFGFPCTASLACGDIRGHGTCDTATGACQCKSGWEGADCSKVKFSGSANFPGTQLVTVEWGETVNGWVGTPTLQWELCYSSFTDSPNTPATFHAQCDQFATTVAVAHNSLNFTFGGYAVGSWSNTTCCAASGKNGCHLCATGPCCVDRTSAADFIFGLGPNEPQRYLANDTLIQRDSTTYYQKAEPDRWPVWGGGALNMGGDNGPPGTTAYCDQGITYGGQANEACGGGWDGYGLPCEGQGCWGKTDLEVWRLA